MLSNCLFFVRLQVVHVHFESLVSLLDVIDERSLFSLSSNKSCLSKLLLLDWPLSPKSNLLNNESTLASSLPDNGLDRPSSPIFPMSVQYHAPTLVKNPVLHRISLRSCKACATGGVSRVGKVGEVAGACNPTNNEAVAIMAVVMARLGVGVQLGAFLSKFRLGCKLGEAWTKTIGTGCDCLFKDMGGQGDRPPKVRGDCAYEQS